MPGGMVIQKGDDCQLFVVQEVLAHLH